MNRSFLLLIFVSLNLGTFAAAKGACNVLAAGQGLTLGQSISSACGGGQYVLLLQTDGNLVEFDNSKPGKPKWSSNTSGYGITHAVMGSDSNFVLYNQYNAKIWSTETSGFDDGYLVLQPEDGNLVLYAGVNFPVWASQQGGNLNALVVSPPTCIQINETFYVSYSIPSSFGSCQFSAEYSDGFGGIHFLANFGAVNGSGAVAVTAPSPSGELLNQVILGLNSCDNGSSVSLSVNGCNR